MLLNLLLLPIIINGNPAPLRVSDDLNAYWNNTREFNIVCTGVAIGGASYNQDSVSGQANITFEGYIGFDDSSTYEYYVSNIIIDCHYSNSEDDYYINVGTIQYNNYLQYTSDFNNFEFTFNYSIVGTELYLDFEALYNNVSLDDDTYLILDSGTSILEQYTNSLIKTYVASSGNPPYVNANELIASQLYNILYSNVDLYGQGYELGYQTGYDTGASDGYARGYSNGYNEGVTLDSTAVTIFNGILNIAFVPINFFLAIFNFEILGINISAFVSALLSICLVIIVVRFVTGKKQSGGD